MIKTSYGNTFGCPVWWELKPDPEALPEPHPEVILGHNQDGLLVTLDITALHAGRLLMQGASGSGKTSLLRRLIAECSRFSPWVAIDPEGEQFAQPVRKFADNQKDTAIHRAWKTGDFPNSELIDLSDMKREQQLAWLADFLEYLVGQRPKELWGQKRLVFIDEAEIFTPRNVTDFDDPTVAKRCRSSLVDLMSRGRKRGLCGIIACHRLADLSKSVAAEARNVMVGGCALDVDIHRAAEVLGWTKRHAASILPKLPPGAFCAVGPAFSQSPSIVVIPK